MHLQMSMKFLSAHFRPTPFCRKISLARSYMTAATKAAQAGILQVIADLLNLSKFQLMKGLSEHIRILITLIPLLAGWAQVCHAQNPQAKEQLKGKEVLQYVVEGKDTIFIDEIKASKVYSRIPKQKGREWRKYYRLVHNFSKAYPYALVARKLVTEADSTIAADKLKGAKRERYISEVQKELFDVFEGQMRQLTVSQGALIMKLVDREVGKSSYNIIKGYKSGITAGFWQGIAKVFGSDLKKPYDPEGEDKETEELVKIWEEGDFPALYWSLFWKDPPEMPIPEKFL